MSERHHISCIECHIHRRVRSEGFIKLSFEIDGLPRRVVAVWGERGKRGKTRSADINYSIQIGINNRDGVRKPITDK